MPVGAADGVLGTGGQRQIVAYQSPGNSGRSYSVRAPDISITLNRLAITVMVVFLLSNIPGAFGGPIAAMMTTAECMTECMLSGVPYPICAAVCGVTGAVALFTPAP